MTPPLLDIHTHRQPLAPGCIISLDAADPAAPNPATHPSQAFSAAIHPWATEVNPAMWTRLEQWLALPNVVAVGEAGIDTLRGPETDIQIPRLERHIALSEQYAKPLILHIVRAWPQLLELHRRLHPTQPWVIHGFRGKPQLAQQLVNAGLYLSLGPNHNPQVPLVIPANRLFAETDTLTHLPLPSLGHPWPDNWLTHI